MSNEFNGQYYFKPYNLETAISQPFYAIPQVLIEDDYFKDLSLEAKLLYGIMQNRTILSRENNWVDENGDIYIYMTLEEATKKLNRGMTNVKKAIKQLKEMGMIQSLRQGFNKPNRIYVCSINQIATNRIVVLRPMDGHNTTNGWSQYDQLDGHNTTTNNKDISNTDLVIKSNYINIITMYNDTCVSLPKVLKISSSREKAIKARLKKYSIDDFKKLFELAEASDFLKGSNDRNWIADFDWLMKDNNFIKTLEGKYNNKSTASGGAEIEKNKQNNYYRTVDSELAEEFRKMRTGEK